MKTTKKKTTKVKKNLKHFKLVDKPAVYCPLCEKQVKDKLNSSIRIITMDAAHLYVGSKRPFIMNYKLSPLCKKCFATTMKKIRKIIYDIS